MSSNIDYMHIERKYYKCTHAPLDSIAVGSCYYLYQATVDDLENRDFRFKQITKQEYEKYQLSEALK